MKPTVAWDSGLHRPVRPAAVDVPATPPWTGSRRASRDSRDGGPAPPCTIHLRVPGSPHPAVASSASPGSCPRFGSVWSFLPRWHRAARSLSLDRVEMVRVGRVSCQQLSSPLDADTYANSCPPVHGPGRKSERAAHFEHAGRPTTNTTFAGAFSRLRLSLNWRGRCPRSTRDSKS